MHVFPAWPLAARTQVTLACAIAGDAVADLSELAELFNVDVDQFAGMLALIATDRLSRLQRREPVEAQSPQYPADRCRRDADLGRDLPARVALPAQGLDFGTCGMRGLARQ